MFVFDGCQTRSLLPGKPDSSSLSEMPWESVGFHGGIERAARDIGPCRALVRRGCSHPACSVAINVAAFCIKETPQELGGRGGETDELDSPSMAALLNVCAS